MLEISRVDVFCKAAKVADGVDNPKKAAQLEKIENNKELFRLFEIINRNMEANKQAKVTKTTFKLTEEEVRDFGFKTEEQKEIERQELQKQEKIRFALAVMSVGLGMAAARIPGFDPSDFKSAVFTLASGTVVGIGSNILGQYLVKRIRTSKGKLKRA